MDLEHDWPEIFTGIFIVLGFFLAVTLVNPFLSYIAVILSGFFAGRVFYKIHKHEPLLPIVLIIIGFVLGYAIGGVWVSRILVLIFFFGAMKLSHELHKRGIIKIFKRKVFIK